MEIVNTGVQIPFVKFAIKVLKKLEFSGLFLKDKSVGLSLIPTEFPSSPKLVRIPSL